MTLDDIRQAIKVADDRIVLSKTTLNSDAVSRLLDEYGKDGTLTIESAEILSRPGDAFVQVRGSVTLLNVAVKGEARFFLDGSDAQLDFNGTPPDGWTLGKSFSSLRQSHLAQMTMDSPRLRLLSKADGATQAGATLAAGFALPPVLEAVRWFAAPAANAQIRGLIDLDAGQPVTTLSVTPVIKAKLGGYLDIDLTMQHVVKAYRKSANQVPVVSWLSVLNGELGYTHGDKTIVVPLQAGFDDQTGVLYFQMVTGQAFDLALSEIAHWLNGTNLGTEGLPVSYRPPAGLTLHDVSFAVGLNTATLEYVSLSVQSTEPWKILGDKIVVSDINLDFKVMPGRSPVLMAAISGTLKLGTAASFDIYAQVPDFLVRGHLSDDSPIDLIPLIQYLGGVSTGVPGKLQIDVLAFEAHPAGSSYSFDIDVVGDWRLVDQVAVTQLKAGLHYSNASLDVGFQGGFTVGGVDVGVTAGYDSDAGGWLFTGSAARKKPITLGTFIANLASQFSSSASQALPEFITSLEIDGLGVSFDTATSAFAFDCELSFTVENTTLDLTFTINLSKVNGRFTQFYGGTLAIGGLHFELAFEKIGAGTDGKGGSSMFLAAVQPDAKIDVRALVAHIDAKAGELMPSLSLELENALFLYRKSGAGPATYLFGLALGVDVNLSSLPLVGSVFQDANLGGIKDIQALFSSTAVSVDDVAAFNGLLGQVQAKPALPTKQGVSGNAQVLGKGFNLAANINLGGKPVPLMAGGRTAPPNSALPAPQSAPAAPPSGNASWFDIKKSIGPVTLDRIGVRYENGRAWLLLDADFLMAGLSLGCQGLAMGLKLDNLTDIAVNLDGLSLEFQSGPLYIGGGFYHFGDDYLGEAKVRAATFGLTAIGGYAPGEKSFFIFVRLNAPLGGPPYFFVNGIAGGFGVNRSLIVPPIDDLTSFALLPANNTFPAKLDQKNPGKSLATTLASTAKYIHPEAGANWAAAGIDFSSFQMVDASALVTVAFGVDFAISLLGICRVTVPKLAPEPVVYLEIALSAQFKPSEGVLAVNGRLTPASHVFAGLVRVTGGFAFYIWFAGENEGDFVISVGGYNPRFQKPDHYPVVPRLQLAYEMGPLVVKGGCYLSLTPHMVMAGLAMDATWQSGPIKAWFDAGIDFLMGWRPFHYEGDAYVHIGVSVSLDLLITSVTITVHVGVDLNVWGPSFGGKATIDLDIVSFTIYFGDDLRKEVVDWAGFKSSFLPAGADKAASAARPLLAAAKDAEAIVDGLLCTAAIATGLIKELKAKDEAEFFSWIVDPDHFIIQSSTLIPSKQATFNSFDLQAPFTKSGGFKPGTDGVAPTPAYDERAYPNGVSWAQDIGVLPMGVAAGGFTSHHTVRVRKTHEGADHTVAANYTEDVVDLSVAPVLKGSSSAMWAPSDPGLNGKRLIADTLVGLKVSPMVQHPDITLKADLWAMLFDQNQHVSWGVVVPATDRQDPYQAKEDGATLSFQLGGKPVTCSDYKLTALTEDSASKARQAVATGLNGLGFAFAPDDIDVGDLAEYPLWDWPMIRTLGEEVGVS